LITDRGDAAPFNIDTILTNSVGILTIKWFLDKLLLFLFYLCLCRVTVDEINGDAKPTKRPDFAGSSFSDFAIRKLISVS
jgi:hypothetical protein